MRLLIAVRDREGR